MGGYIDPGQTVLDIGCGSGIFSVAMAKMVGDHGKVIAVDVQDEMLQMVRKKAAKYGLQSRIITHRSNTNKIGISDRVDFILAFYMVHEVPDVQAFLNEIAGLLNPNGKLLVVEPKIHVSASSFKKTLQAAGLAGLEPISEPRIRLSRGMLFQLRRTKGIKKN